MLRRADFVSRQGGTGSGRPFPGMNRAQLPDDVVQFLLSKVDSVPQLEALLLLQADPDVSWSRVSIGQRLYISDRDVAPILAQLTRANLLVKGTDDTFRFNRDSSDAGVVQKLSEYYQKHLMTIARIVHEKPAFAVREFAQAFTVKKEE